MALVIGVLALQGAFLEHLVLLKKASRQYPNRQFQFIEVRTPSELARCDGLIIPGGESTTLSLVAERSGLLEPLRDYVKYTKPKSSNELPTLTRYPFRVHRKPTWGTCAGLILLAEAANATKKGGQGLIGGLDVRVHRNHFGRQIESFEADLDLPFLAQSSSDSQSGDQKSTPFHAIFIRAPVVDKLLSHTAGPQSAEAAIDDTVVAPSRQPKDEKATKRTSDTVEVLARLPSRLNDTKWDVDGAGDIVAVRQGNCFGISFHPELTDDVRIHAWWLSQVIAANS